MAIAFDAATESIRTATTDPYTFTHTPVGTPRGIALAITHGETVSGQISSVTYGGQSMTIQATRTLSFGGEAGRTQWWYLGTGIPTGAQTVSIDLTSATTIDMQFVCISLTANTDTSVIAVSNTDGWPPTGSFSSDALTGQSAYGLSSHWSNKDDTSGVTALTDCTIVDDYDFGTWTSWVVRRNSPGTSFNIGLSGTAGPVAATASIAVAEQPPVILDTDVRIQGSDSTSETRDTRVTGYLALGMDTDVRLTASNVDALAISTRISGVLFSETARDARITGIGDTIATSWDSYIVGEGTNLDFEDSVGGWVEQNSAIEQTTEEFYTGASSMKVNPQGTDPTQEGVTSAGQKIDVSPLKRVTVTSQYKADVDGLPLRVEISQYSAEDTILDSDFFDITGMTEWQTFEENIDTVANASYIIIGYFGR